MGVLFQNLDHYMKYNVIWYSRLPETKYCFHPSLLQDYWSNEWVLMNIFGGVRLFQGPVDTILVVSVRRSWYNSDRDLGNENSRQRLVLFECL